MSKTQLQLEDAFGNIDFDHWSEIARTDPETFEAMRTKIIRSCIDSAPQDQQQRMRGLQWQVDCLRAQSRNPLSACLKISRMMWDTLQKLGDVSRDLTRPEQAETKSKSTAATILPFSLVKK
ncbi:hypothetical protein MNBD_GAMMA24-323 [hydrothermal vent metagenome]|uniref:DUF3135 domain-containing protein n=1 Tax=hydrothermal vent metagenome TaxID=652676 RepID=A0A3B1BND1_9ZZZZ